MSLQRARAERDRAAAWAAAAPARCRAAAVADATAEAAPPPPPADAAEAAAALASPLRETEAASRTALERHRIGLRSRFPPRRHRATAHALADALRTVARQIASATSSHAEQLPVPRPRPPRPRLAPEEAARYSPPQEAVHPARLANAPRPPPSSRRRRRADHAEAAANARDRGLPPRLVARDAGGDSPTRSPRPTHRARRLDRSSPQGLNATSACPPRPATSSTPPVVAACHRRGRRTPPAAADRRPTHALEQAERASPPRRRNRPSPTCAPPPSPPPMPRAPSSPPRRRPWPRSSPSRTASAGRRMVDQL